MLPQRSFFESLADKAQFSAFTVRTSRRHRSSLGGQVADLQQAPLGSPQSSCRRHSSIVPWTPFNPQVITARASLRCSPIICDHRSICPRPSLRHLPADTAHCRSRRSSVHRGHRSSLPACTSSSLRGHCAMQTKVPLNIPNDPRTQLNAPQRPRNHPVTVVTVGRLRLRSVAVGRL